MGFHEASANLIVNDLDEDLLVWSENDPPISIGDDASLWCGASAHKYANELNWFKDNAPIKSGNGRINATIRSCLKFIHKNIRSLY